MQRTALFVDLSNVYYGAKEAGITVDYRKLLVDLTGDRSLVRAYAYTGVDPENEGQKAFQQFLRDAGYKVVAKEVRRFADGGMKANLDIELVVDLIRLAPRLDAAVIVSGDGDFAPAIRAVQEMGVRVEVAGFRRTTSADLLEVADEYRDLARLADGASRPERPLRAGRRVGAAAPEKEGQGPRPRGRRSSGRTAARPRRRSRSSR